MPRSKPNRFRKRYRKFVGSGKSVMSGGGGGRRRKRGGGRIRKRQRGGVRVIPLINAVRHAKAMYDAPFGIF